MMTLQSNRLSKYNGAKKMSEFINKFVVYSVGKEKKKYFEHIDAFKNRQKIINDLTENSRHEFPAMILNTKDDFCLDLRNNAELYDRISLDKDEKLTVVDENLSLPYTATVLVFGPLERTVEDMRTRISSDVNITFFQPSQDENALFSSEPKNGIIYRYSCFVANTVTQIRGDYDDEDHFTFGLRSKLQFNNIALKSIQFLDSSKKRYSVNGSW